jgi:TonB family protein
LSFIVQLNVSGQQLQEDPMKRCENSLRRLLGLAALAIFTLPTCALAQGTMQPVTPGEGGHTMPSRLSPDAAARSLKQVGTVEVISDSFGIDLDPYIRFGVLRFLRGKWHDYAPVGTEQPPDKRGQASIEFDILKDGQVNNVTLAASSGDSEIDDAALDAAKRSAPYMPLPSEFPGDYLRLRCQLLYNPGRRVHVEIIGANHDPRVANALDQGERALHRSDGTTPPRATYNPPPEFSEQARRKKLQGTVSLKVKVSAEGDVEEVTVVKGLGSGLDEKAVETVRTWKFKPALDKNGTPVAAEIAVETNFHLY